MTCRHCHGRRYIGNRLDGEEPCGWCDDCDTQEEDKETPNRHPMPAVQQQIIAESNERFLKLSAKLDQLFQTLQQS